MPNVIAINAAARKSIVAARATTDEMLLESISEGGRNAMHVLYSRHNVRVYRFVLRMVRDTTLAEDLVSQVFLDVWRTASQFEGRSQVSTWLLSIARFKALTALRQRKHEDIDQDDVLEIADDADTPEASLDRSNTSAILRACVAKLSPAHREIINLVYYHEKSVEEAGQIIGIPQSTVKTRMFYARKQLADLLKGCRRGQPRCINHQQFQSLNLDVRGENAPAFRRRRINADETNETIDNIRRKNSAAYTSPQQRNTNAEQESEHAEAVLPPLHYPARRRLHPGLAVRPERLAPRPARYRRHGGPRTGGRLQHQEPHGGLRDLRRQRNECPLKQFLL